MHLNFEDWDEALLDLEDFQAERALQNAALDALHRARRCGTDFVIWENDRVTSLKPSETGPYEKRMIENLDRLNRKIAELESQSAAALALNDKPKT
jgi:hypothetical protein